MGDYTVIRDSTLALARPNTKVFVRILPDENMNLTDVKILDDKKTIYVRCLQDFMKGSLNTTENYWHFKTDGVFVHQEQNLVSETMLSGIIDKVMDGCDVIFVAYGQTGTGKSTTIFGLNGTFDDRGLVPRVISNLFTLKTSKKREAKVELDLSYIETFKLYQVDLLDPNSTPEIYASAKKPLRIRLKDEFHAMRLLFKAEGRRDISENANYFSHIANAVTTIHIQMESYVISNAVQFDSKIHFVDLAGADNYGNSSCIWKKVLEVGNANLAKSQLEQLLMGLKTDSLDRNKRINAIIQYLSDSITSHTVLRYIAHIRASRKDLIITLSMLRFLLTVRRVKMKKCPSKVGVSKEMQADLLEMELKLLKKEMYLNSMLVNQDLSSNLSQMRITHMQNAAQDYLNSEIDELTVMNVTDVQTVMKVFKDLFNELKIEKAEQIKEAYEKGIEEAVENNSSSKGSIKGSRKHRESSIALSKGSATKIKNGTKKKPQWDKSSQEISLGEASVKTDSPGSHETVQMKKSETMESAKPSHKKSSFAETKSDKSVESASVLQKSKGPAYNYNLPKQSEAWDAFVDSNHSEHETFMENTKVLIDKCKTLQKVFLEESEKLQQSYDYVELRRKDQLKIDFKAQCAEKRGGAGREHDLVIRDVLEKAERELLGHQEAVLKLQTEISSIANEISISRENHLKKFTEFCETEFSMQIAPPNTMETDEMVSVKEEDASFGENEPQEHDFYHLRKFMAREMDQKAYRSAKNKSWVKYFKLP